MDGRTASRNLETDMAVQKGVKELRQQATGGKIEERKKKKGTTIGEKGSEEMARRKTSERGGEPYQPRTIGEINAKRVSQAGVQFRDRGPSHSRHRLKLSTAGTGNGRPKARRGEGS